MPSRARPSRPSEPRIAVEDAREDHRRQRVAHPVVGGRAAGAGELVEVHRELAARESPARRADVQEQREPDVLGRPPEPVVDRVPIRPVGQRRDRDERADQPEPGAALELVRGLLDVVDVEHRDALEAVGKRLAEVGDPVVVAAADGREQLAIRDAVPEEALARLQARAPHAVHLVFLDHRLRLVRAVPDVLPHPQEVDRPGSSKRWPAWITAPRVPTCCPPIVHASNFRPVGVSSRSIGARDLRNFGSIRVVVEVRRFDDV